MPVLTYKCSNCGGDLTFDPTTQKFKCKYCGSTFEQAELEAKETKNTEEQIEKENEVRTDEELKNEFGDITLFTCPSCGAEIAADNTTAATTCFYCQNPVVMTGRLDGKFLPRRLIPFKYTKDDAVKKFVEWTKKKKYLPKDFFSKQQIEKLQGVYFPYWLVDCDTSSSLRATGDKVRSWTSGDTRYTETKVYDLVRDGDIHLEDIIKSALSKANKRLVESVQPFDGKELQKFSMTYLSGFVAEKRDIERDALEKEVDGDIHKFNEQLLKNTTSEYSNVKTTHLDVNIDNIDWEYALLPVWTMTYKYKDTMYYYAMNGQNGKTCGKLPVDMGKLIRHALIAALAVGVVLGLGGFFLI